MAGDEFYGPAKQLWVVSLMDPAAGPRRMRQGNQQRVAGQPGVPMDLSDQPIEGGGRKEPLERQLPDRNDHSGPDDPQLGLDVLVEGVATPGAQVLEARLLPSGLPARDLRPRRQEFFRPFTPAEALEGDIPTTATRMRGSTNTTGHPICFAGVTPFGRRLF